MLTYLKEHVLAAENQVPIEGLIQLHLDVGFPIWA
jgi:hypothetical protein